VDRRLLLPEQAEGAGLVFALLWSILKRLSDHGYKILQCEIDSLGVLKLCILITGDRDVGESTAGELGNRGVSERRNFDRVCA
jgi:hypothetical protein